MRYPTALSDLRSSGYRRDDEYVIHMPGLAQDTVGRVTIDDQYAVIQVPGSYELRVTSRPEDELPSFSDLVFFTYCLSYEHDLAASLYPIDGPALVAPIEKGHHDYIYGQYVNSLDVAYESLNAVRLGPLAWTAFRWSAEHKNVNLDYSTKYVAARKEVGLYSHAVRQLDPLAEYLFYYRVVESIAGNNGKNWVRHHLEKLRTHDFGFVEIGFDSHWIAKRRRRMNLFTVYRQRALSRLTDLKECLDAKEIADHLYNENRCGIAHGGSAIKVHDFGDDIRDVVRDICIVKLLARIAIDEQVGGGASTESGARRPDR